MSAEPEVKTFDETYVKSLRAESARYRTERNELEAEVRPVFKKGYLPPEVKPSNSDVQVHIHKFPKGDVENFSLSRAALAKALASASPAMRVHIWQDVAPWEFQYLTALGDVRFKALGDAVSGQDGGYIAPEFWSTQWFDVLRSESAIDQLPVQRFQTPYRVGHFPKITNDVTVYYPGENTAGTQSSFKFGQLSYNARKAVAYMRASNEMIRDGGETVDQAFRQSTAKAIALDRDTQIFVGSTVSAGGPAPVGFIQQAIGGQVGLYYVGSSSATPLTATATSGTPFYQTIGQLIGKVEQLNSNANVSGGQATCNGIAANAQFRQTVYSSGNFLDSSNRPVWLADLNADGGFYGQRWALSNAIPTATTVGGKDGSIMVAGDWRQFALFECLTLGFDSTLHSQAFANDETEIRVVHRWDAAPIHPEAFVVLAGVKV